MSTSKHTAKIVKSGDFHWVGNGFPVRSVFGYNDLGKELSPFLLLDYAAPYEFSPSTEKRGVGAHPHRGFETVTLAYKGEIEHRDSSGGGGKIGPGDVQWMTAAGGLLHEEFHSADFTRQGGVFEMAQLWVNLPAKHKSAAPGYQTITDANIPRALLSGETGEVRIIAGEFNGTKGPAKTFTPMNLWDVSVRAGSDVRLELPAEHTKALFLLRGQVRVDNKDAEDGDLIIFDRKSSSISFTSHSDSKLLLLSGEPIEEPVVGYGPFVMNTQAEIRQAFADFQMGKMGHLD